jgi:ABC-2 type transport system permease protein
VSRLSAGTTAARSFILLSGFHSRQLLRTSFFVQLALTAPVSFSLLRVLGSMGAGSGVPDSLWFDAAIAGMWATTTTAVGIIGFQRFQGTLEFLSVSTLSPGVVFGSLTTAAAVIGWLGLPIGLLLQWALSGSITVTLFQMLGVLAASLACLASACVLAALFVMSRSATAFEPLILVPIWLLCGIVVPLTALPRWLQFIALLHPLTSAVEAGRHMGAGSGIGWIATSVFVSACWLGMATIALRAALRRARVAGTLSLS